MAEAKQPGHLNGAYYGPAAPPPRHRHSYQSVSRGSSGCCCLPCCILCTFIKFIVGIIVTLGIIVLIMWLILRPNNIKVYVDNASLTQFNLASSNPGSTLSYNLTLDMSIRNPNRWVGIYYDYTEARAFYQDTRFSYVPLPTFYQGHKNTTILHPAFQGQQAVAVGSSVTAAFDREKGEGNFYVDVQLYANVRLWVLFVKTGTISRKADCSLRLPVPSNGTSAAFTWMQCHAHFF